MARQTTYSNDQDVAIEGALACRRNEAEIDSCFNGEASTELPFGTGCMWGSATDGQSVKAPTAETSKIKGIIVHSHAYECGPTGDLGDTGIKSGGNVNVLRKGSIWVKVRTGCAPGDKLWVRAVGGGLDEVVGGCENADDGTDTVDCTAKGEFQTYAAAGGLAKLRVNF